jgi:hypothetical protein
MVLLAEPMDGLVWIMAGAAFHFPIGSQVALAAEHPDWLKSSHGVGVIA